MRQLNQNVGIASLPEIDVYSTALLVDDGLDKKDILGQIDDQEGERIICSACVEFPKVKLVERNRARSCARKNVCRAWWKVLVLRRPIWR
jgi:hypothetical protein